MKIVEEEITGKGFGAKCDSDPFAADNDRANGEDASPVPELSWFNPAEWVIDPKPEERKWIVPDYILDGTTTPLFGDGGTDKSYLAHQLTAARALAREWIGLLPAPGRTLMLSCEDNLEEMKRRLYGILQFYNAGWGDLGNNVGLVDLVGRDSILALLKHGIIEPAPMYHALDALMAAFGPGLTILDVLTALFAGNELIRVQVRQFSNLLNALCRKHNSAILLLAHPSLAGMNTGTGLSGSTDWHNAFRCRTYLDTIRNGDADTETNFRVFKGMKNNYGELGGKITPEWKKGLYVPVREVSGVEKLIMEAKTDENFMEKLKRRVSADRAVSDKPGSNYAPAIFAREPDAIIAGITGKQFEAAMERLFAAGKIRVEVNGPPSRCAQGKAARSMLFREG